MKLATVKGTSAYAVTRLLRPCTISIYKGMRKVTPELTAAMVNIDSSMERCTGVFSSCITPRQPPMRRLRHPHQHQLDEHHAEQHAQQRGRKIERAEGRARARSHDAPVDQVVAAQADEQHGQPDRGKPGHFHRGDPCTRQQAGIVSQIQTAEVDRGGQQQQQHESDAPVVPGCDRAGDQKGRRKAQASHRAQAPECNARCSSA